MDAKALKYPLFAGDPALLKRKLDTAGGLLAEYYRDFHQRFMADSAGSRAAMLALPALVDDAFIPEAREAVSKFYRNLPALDTNDAIQLHTWCYCGAALRQAVFFDWLASRGAWSREEIEEAAEHFLTFAFKHPYMVSLSRCRASNNQILSVALFCAVVGFLFGHKLTQHPTGKFLFDQGLGRLPDLIGLFPGDGYGGEGSTYTSNVNIPLACWTAEFLRTVTGHDWLDTPFRPNGTTLRKMIEMELRLLSPGGLLAPWDHYGWQPEVNAAPFAYLARAAGNRRYLSLIPSLVDRRTSGMLAWGADDPLWMLLWWPEEFATYDKREIPAELFGWFLPKTGAALDDVPRRARLMQVWDMSGESVANIGRAQCNPNHIMFDYAGEPVFQDGIQDDGRDPWQYPADKVFTTLDDEERKRYLSYQSSMGKVYEQLQKVIVGIAPGLIGCANAIVVDDEPWYWPGGPRVGRPELYSAKNGLQVVRADCASFYQPRYDVDLARRTSLWSSDGFGVVLDDLRARSSHTWTWQVYLRPDVTVDANSARVKLSSGKTVLLAWEAADEVRTEAVDGFPRTEEKRSCLLSLRKSGSEAGFAVVIAPEAESASIRRITDDQVEVVLDGKKHLLRVPAGAPIAPTPDVHDLSDIELDRDIQVPELEHLLRWPCESMKPGPSRLSQIDACLAQIATTEADTASLLLSLRSPHWPVQVAAAEALGRRGCSEATPALRQLLEKEHARPKEDLYPSDGKASEGRSLEDLANRWRLKTALVVALGRLRDREAVQLLGKILADGRDFYAVHSVAAQAIGRIGGAHARAALEPALKETEHNTRIRARAARKAIEGVSK